MDSEKPVVPAKSEASKTSHDTKATNSTANPQAEKINMPKRLIALLVFLVVISISGLMAKQGVLFCILTLFMVLAIIGKQKAGLIMLRVYTSLQLAIASALPIMLHDPDNMVPSEPSSYGIGSFSMQLPDWLVFAVLIILSFVQVWIAFTPKVSRYFSRALNLNIMR
ncbi:membrane protein [Shewanella sairae]|uniref:Membrane protein n=1 Tax=Shewanella sairae TaxID=190310 RepID=A0ABQ4P2Y9_9GAMM|nr:hypothetical protein [Shewanella sairae]GIU41865.1 membrane protein [Shewanella sairae]